MALHIFVMTHRFQQKYTWCPQSDPQCTTRPQKSSQESPKMLQDEHQYLPKSLSWLPAAPDGSNIPPRPYKMNHKVVQITSIDFKMKDFEWKTVPSTSQISWWIHIWTKQGINGSNQWNRKYVNRWPTQRWLDEAANLCINESMNQRNPRTTNMNTCRGAGGRGEALRYIYIYIYVNECHV